MSTSTKASWITDYTAHPKPSEGSTAPTTVSPNRPVFQIHKPDTVDLATLPGLIKMTGEPAGHLRRLPSAPLQPTEKRWVKWLARFGRQQTELDALMALRPGQLETLLYVAIESFFDRTLDRRFDAANTLPTDALEWFKARPAYTAAVEAIAPLREAANAAADELAEAVEHHVAEVRRAVREAGDAPKLDPVEIKPELTGEPPEPLFHTLDGFVPASKKLIARRDGGGGEVDDPEDGSDDAEGGAA